MIPLSFMIGLFGSRINRIKASYYLFFFTISGSILFLIALFIIDYFYNTFDIITLYNIELDENIQKIL